MDIQKNLLKRIVTYLSVLFFLGSCQDDDTPVIRFSVNYESSAESNYLYHGQRPTYIPLKIKNASFDADTYLWSFGDGSTSTEREPVFSYKKSGIYVITLTATSQTGRQQVSKQSIKIVDRVLKQVTIEKLNWNALGNLPNWPATKTANIQLAIGQRLSKDPPLTMSVLLYESSLITNVSTTRPASIPITQKIIIDPVVNLNFLVAILYGYDSTGKALLFSGGGFSASTEGPTGLFIMMSSVGGTTLRFECAYE